MTLADEKREIVEIVTGVRPALHEDAEIKQRLYELFTRDTNNKKLYKYRRVNNHSLSNLASNTLYCSKPSALNDLFDCKLGVSFCELFDVICKPFFQNVSAVFDNLCFCIDNQLDIHVCGQEEQAIMNTILSYEPFVEFRRAAHNHPPTNRDVVEWLLDNPCIISKIFCFFTEDRRFKRTSETISYIIPRLFSILNYERLMTILNPECTFKMFASAIGVDGDFDEINLFVKVCEKLCPEYASEVDKEVTQALDVICSKILEPIYNSFLVGSLSTDYKNRLLWAHYADSNKGFCIEFDFSAYDFSQQDILLLPVLYSSKRCTFPWSCLIEGAEKSEYTATARASLSLFSKDQIWDYENEWRILRRSCEEANFQMPRISCVYLGAAISEENREKILEISRENGLKVMQMVEDYCTYELHVKDIC